MSAAVFISLLLLGTPVQSAQDSVSAQRVERLESRITELEKQVLEYRAREDYFQSILASQRWTFGTVVALFAALVGLVGFGVFKRYVSEVVEVKSEMENRMEEEVGTLRSQAEKNEGRVQNAERRAFKNARILMEDRRNRHASMDFRRDLEALLNDMLDIAKSASDEVVDEINLRNDIDDALDVMRSIRSSDGEVDDMYLRRMHSKAHGIRENTENPVSMRANTLMEGLEEMMDEKIEQ
jgi:chaperonin cofactor prefoldin